MGKKTCTSQNDAAIFKCTGIQKEGVETCKN